MTLISVLKKKNNTTLFTTPSHDGKLCILHKFYQWYRSDISEIDALEPDKALYTAEVKAAKLYGTQITKFLTNGSTSGIIAAVLACCKPNDKILIWDNAHPCHKNGAILAGAKTIEYTLPYNNEWGVYENLTAEMAEKLFKEYLPKAIIITSPSYEGITADIKNISKVCEEYGVLLIVDEAHGALYPFSNNLPESAIHYADFTVQSLHKTAGGINPTALLHTKTHFDISKTLNMINTTSPSYPMLATIEANINYLNSSKGKHKIETLILQINDIKNSLKNIKFFGDDPTKILMKKEGLSGYELSELLFKKFKIEDERTNEKSTMLLTGLGTDKAKLDRLKKVLLKIDKS